MRDGDRLMRRCMQEACIQRGMCAEYMEKKACKEAKKQTEKRSSWQFQNIEQGLSGKTFFNLRKRAKVLFFGETVSNLKMGRNKAWLAIKGYSLHDCTFAVHS